ncbi:MAG: DUF4262 domain-containing protein [Bacteroidota bacterium]
MDSQHEKHDRETEVLIRKNVKKFGWHVSLFNAEGYQPPFAYTIGLYESFGHPELIGFGLPPQLLGTILNSIGQQIQAEGLRVVTDKYYYDIIDRYPVQFVEVHPSHYPEYLGYCGWYYQFQFDFPILQLVWPDRDSNFPWDEAYEPAYRSRQLLLDNPALYQFRASKHLDVITTRQVMEGAPILHVMHTESGEWQFHSEAEPAQADVAIVKLGQLVHMDPTLNQLSAMPKQHYAFRSAANSPWEVFDESQH